MKQLFDHLLPGGRVLASIMTLWKAGEPLVSEWESSAVRPEDGVKFRRVARSRFDPASECEHTEDRYQKIIAGQVVLEEHYQRSPATRSYSQSQAKALFESAGLQEIQLLHEFSFDPARPEDDLFVVIGQKPGAK